MSLSIRNDRCQRCKRCRIPKWTPFKISQVQSIDEIVKFPSDRAEAGADDAERTKRNTRISCVSQQTQSTKRRLTMNSREQHPRKRCQKRESMKAPPDMKTGRSLRTCLSRGVPVDHQARSQVKKPVFRRVRSAGTSPGLGMDIQRNVGLPNVEQTKHAPLPTSINEM